MGTRAVPHQGAVAPLIILSPIVTRCNSPSHDWWCRCLITPRQNPPKITFRSRSQLCELHEVHWRGWRREACWTAVTCTPRLYYYWARISKNEIHSYFTIFMLPIEEVTLSWGKLTTFRRCLLMFYWSVCNFLDALNKTLRKVSLIRSAAWCGPYRHKKATV